MKQLEIRTKDHSYNIHIGCDILKQSGEYIRKIYNGSNATVVTDQNVWGLYGDALTSSLKLADININPIILPPGESTKSLGFYGEILEHLAKVGHKRNDLIIAFGGGVVGDLAGLVGATYMRGVPVVQIPTTLLSQIDSSVGGKTAINLPQGKNLVGAFYQPSLVIADTSTLNSLSNREFAGGVAEVIKYGAIFSDEFFEELTKANSRQKLMENIDSIVWRCCDYKRAVVEIDEKDTKQRLLLNFGHTFGHSIEKLGGYTRYTHGEAVAIGMVLALLYGEQKQITQKGTAKKLYDICLSFGLPVDNNINPKELAEYFRLDKKSSTHSITLILLNKIGDAFACKEDLLEFEQSMGRLEEAFLNMRLQHG